MLLRGPCEFLVCWLNSVLLKPLFGTKPEGGRLGVHQRAWTQCPVRFAVMNQMTSCFLPGIDLEIALSPESNERFPCLSHKQGRLSPLSPQISYICPACPVATPCSAAFRRLSSQRVTLVPGGLAMR